jgi:spermidine synthase
VEAPGGRDVKVAPYWAHVPSFGEWGFVLAAPRSLAREAIELPVETRYLTEDLLPRQFAFGKDTGPLDGPVNDLDDQPLVRLYEQGYERYYD